MEKLITPYLAIGRKTNLYRYRLLFLTLLLTLPFANDVTAQLAFPNAVGAGAYATGGRGGTVIHVTNLNNSGPGSFREAFNTPGPRIIVFDVSGTINCLSSLSTPYDDVTVAGQSAPEGGITFTGDLGNSPIFEISGRDNMIFRHIRVRPEYYYGGSNADAFQGYNCSNIIVDHCSVSWGGDECLSFGGNTSNISVQNSIIAESKTGSIMGNPSSPQNAQNLSMVGNLFFQISRRHPNTPTNGRVDVINNVIWGYRYRTNRPANGYPRLNEINNYYITDTPRPLGEMGKIDWEGIEPQIYTKGNLHLPSTVTNPNLPNNNDTWTAFGSSDGAYAFNYNGQSYYDDDPAPDEFFTSVQHPIIGQNWNMLTAEESLEHAKTDVGANKSLNASGDASLNWDSVDDFYINHVNNGTLLTVSSGFTMAGKAHYENFLSSVSSTPVNSRGSSYYQSSPHIPEAWFVANVPNGETALDYAPSGYTWIEEFLNGVDAEQSTSVSAGDDQSICEGDNTILTATGASTYLWSTGQTTASISVSPNINTTYTVTGNPGTADESVDSVTVFVNATPTANAGDDVTICTEETATLVASGGGSYLWSTGETTQSISVSPDQDTVYTVTVTSNGCQDTDNVTVFVNPAPNASAGDDVTILQGESTTLTATGGNDYLWSTGETTQSITVTPTQTTTYSVEVSNGTCSRIVEVTVFVEEPVTANAGEDQTICEGEGATLIASGGTDYLWSTGETTQSINVNPMVTTTYSVTVSDEFSSDTDEVTVNVNEVPIAYAGEDQFIQLGELATLTAEGGDTYLWSTGETTQSIDVSPTESTTYMVTVFSNGCEDFDDVEVVVDGVLANAGEDVSICEGETVTLTATGGDFFLWSTGETTASIQVSPSQTTIYTVEVSDGFSYDTDDVTVFVNSTPNANVGSDETICEGETVTLTATGGETYLWSTGETTPSIEVTPLENTTYTVTAFNGGCEDSDSVNVEVNPNPVANAGNDVNITEGESVTLTASGGGSYEWSTGETTQSIEVSPLVTTVYTVFVTQNGCEDFDEVTVTVNDAVNANAGEDVTICQGNETILTASGGESYLWSTGETTQSIVVSPMATSTYTVIVSNEFSSDTDEVTVTVNPLPNVQVTGDVSILQGDFVTLSATGANSYLWNNGATEPNIAVSPNVTTTYSVTGYINNCSETEDVVVSVFEPVEANAGQDETICFGSSIELTASGGDSYLWNTGETTQSITVSPEIETTYTVIVSNELDSDADEVIVSVENCEIELPNEDPPYEFSLYMDRINPSIMMVKLSGLEGNSMLYVHDISGNLVLSLSIQDNNGQQQEIPINTALYSQGVYVITLQEQNKQTPKQVLFR